jgi:hypothetical protein
VSASLPHADFAGAEACTEINDTYAKHLLVIPQASAARRDATPGDGRRSLANNCARSA